MLAIVVNEQFRKILDGLFGSSEISSSSYPYPWLLGLLFDLLHCRLFGFLQECSLPLALLDQLDAAVGDHQHGEGGQREPFYNQSVANQRGKLQAIESKNVEKNDARTLR